MFKDAAEKDPLVFLWAAVLFCTEYLSGTWLYEGQDPGEEIGTGSVLCSKDDQAVGEEALPMLVQKREDNKKKKKNSSKQ